MCFEAANKRILLKAVFVLFTLVVPLLAVAKEGGTSGGGSAKAPVSFGNENLQAILQSSVIQNILGLNFSIEEIKLITVNRQGYEYRVEAKTRNRAHGCVIRAVVWNTDSATVGEVVVRSAEVSEGCVIQNTAAESVFSAYKNIFDLFRHLSGDDQRLYSEYLEVARKLSPAVRAEIRNRMKTSEARFYEAYSKNAKRMAATVNAHPEMNIGNAMYMLSMVMGIDPNGEGIQMPVIVGLQLAPFFIVDAEQL